MICNEHIPMRIKKTCKNLLNIESDECGIKIDSILKLKHLKIIIKFLKKIFKSNDNLYLKFS